MEALIRVLTCSILFSWLQAVHHAAKVHLEPNKISTKQLAVFPKSRLLPHGRSDRGVGIKYGPDVTTKFCSQNRLRRRTELPFPSHVEGSGVKVCRFQVPGSESSSARRWVALAKEFDVSRRCEDARTLPNTAQRQAWIPEATQWPLRYCIQRQQLLWRWRVLFPECQLPFYLGFSRKSGVILNNCLVVIDFSWFSHHFFVRGTLVRS